MKEKETLQTSVEYLANLCLGNDGIYHGYTDEEFLNSTLIFSYFLFDKMWTKNQHLSSDKIEELSITTGEAIRELIKSCTNKDMHEVTKRVLKIKD